MSAASGFPAQTSSDGHTRSLHRLRSSLLHRWPFDLTYNKTTDLAVAADKERLAENLHKQAFALAEESLKLRQKYDPGLTFTYDVVDGQLERTAVSQAPKRDHLS